MLKQLGFLVVAGLFLAMPEAGAAPKELTKEEAEKMASELKPQTGKVELNGGLATITVADGFEVLNAKDARVVLSDIWGNPPDSSILGMIVPKGFNPLKADSWVVAISFDDSGYVTDDDADKTDYNKLLKEMQASAAEANVEREKEGYPSIQLVGWAATPKYDAEAHKLYWAKELEFGGDPEHTLNYNIRVLGRRGVLVLNAIAGMNQLPEIEKAMPEVIGMVNFDEGHRYVDFDPKIDKVAGYGLAALVAGGVLAKTGLLKGLIAALIAGKKFIIIGVVALVAGLKKFVFGRKE